VTTWADSTQLTLSLNKPTTKNHKQQVFKAFSWLTKDRVAQSAQCLTINWITGVRSPSGTDNSPLASVSRLSPGPQPPVQQTPGILFPGVKHGWVMMLTTHSHLAKRLRRSRSYTSSPPSTTMAFNETALLYLMLTKNIILKQPLVKQEHTILYTVHALTHLTLGLSH
jgi:hypothetical protein